tara:strand:- start:8434 stop:9222 length:789 start_codon:yes stop_codon:yes gene_type:complete
VITLYHNDMSSCAQKVRLVLAAKGIPWDGKHLNLRGGDQHQPDYLKLNPAGVVPTLVHDGTVVRESNIIAEYLDDLSADPPLRPSDPMARAQMRLWMKRLDDRLHAETGVVSSAIAFRYQKLAQGREAAEKLTEEIPDPAKRERMRSITFEGTASPLFAGAIRQFRRLIDDIETALAHRDWLVGDSLSLADIAYAPYATRLDHLQLSGMWQPDSRFADWYARLQAMPAYQAGLADWFNDDYLALMTEKGAEAWPQVQEILAE